MPTPQTEQERMDAAGVRSRVISMDCPDCGGYADAEVIEDKLTEEVLKFRWIQCRVVRDHWQVS